MTTQDYRKIKAHLKDNTSIRIFVNSVKYNRGEIDAFDAILKNTFLGERLLDFLNRGFLKIYIFGAGILGREFFQTFCGGKYPFEAFVDNDKEKQGTFIDGMKVLALDEIKIDKNIGFVVVNKYYTEEIIIQLVESGISKKNIFNFNSIQSELNHRQYFDLKELNLNTVSFVDCGALDGNTSVWLNEYCKNINKIWAFEPDKKNIEKCRIRLQTSGIPTEIIGKALWSSETKLCFEEDGNGMSRISGGGDVEVEAIDLDSVIEKRKDLFIKMDIEGAEYEALIGAKGIIKSCKPQMAICVYHGVKDIYRIPLLLLKYNPDYNFYLRHYSLTKMETVLYAIPNKGE